METLRKKQLDREGLMAILIDQTGNLELYVNGVQTKLGTPIFRHAGADTFVLLYGDREIEIEIPDWNEDLLLERIAEEFNEAIQK